MSKADFKDIEFTIGSASYINTRPSTVIGPYDSIRITLQKTQTLNFIKSDGIEGYMVSIHIKMDAISKSKSRNSYYKVTTLYNNKTSKTQIIDDQGLTISESLSNV